MNRQILVLSRKGGCLNTDPEDLSKSAENRLPPVEKGFHDKDVKH